MEIVEGPSLRSHLDLFGEETLAKEKLLAEAWKTGGEKAVREELKKMYPDEAAATEKALQK